MTSAVSTPPALRERLVRPRDSTIEASLVAAVVLVALAAACLRAMPMLVERAARDRLSSYQLAETALLGDAALLYRTLTAAVPDVVSMRQRAGKWPQPAALAAAGVPPFAPATLPAALRGTIWAGYDGGSWIDYNGQTATPATGAFVLRVIDLHADYHPHPHPGVDYDPVQRTATQVWWFPKGLAKYPGERLGEAGGAWIVGAPAP